MKMAVCPVSTSEVLEIFTAQSWHLVWDYKKREEAVHNRERQMDGERRGEGERKGEERERGE